MASIKNLKKFVVNQTNELLDDCRLTLFFNPKVDEEKIIDIIIKGVDLRNELFDTINNPQEKDNLKKYYKTNVIDKLYKDVDDLFEELSSLFKAN